MNAFAIECRGQLHLHPEWLQFATPDKQLLHFHRLAHQFSDALFSAPVGGTCGGFLCDEMVSMSTSLPPPLAGSAPCPPLPLITSLSTSLSPPKLEISHGCRHSGLSPSGVTGTETFTCVWMWLQDFSPHPMSALHVCDSHTHPNEPKHHLSSDTFFAQQDHLGVWNYVIDCPNLMNIRHH